MNQRQFNDLARLAIERCRESAISVGQLMEDDKERAALLMSCANDFIEGAANLVTNLDEGVGRDEALGAVLAMMFRGLGTQRMMRALNSDPTFKALKAKKEEGK